MAKEKKNVTLSFTERHKHLELLLDRLLLRVTVDAGAAFQEALPAILAHYREEEPFLAVLAGKSVPLASKIAGQHAEAREIATRLEEAIAEGRDADVRMLTRRFHAIAQHNIIEEERDLFPIADRCLTEGENAELLRGLGG